MGEGGCGFLEQNLVQPPHNLSETAWEALAALGLIQTPKRPCPPPSEGLGQASYFIRWDVPVLFILLSIQAVCLLDIYCVPGPVRKSVMATVIKEMYIVPEGPIIRLYKI